MTERELSQAVWLRHETRLLEKLLEREHDDTLASMLIEHKSRLEEERMRIFAYVCCIHDAKVRVIAIMRYL